MPTCITCGVHYKLSREYNDVVECQACSSVIVYEDLQQEKEESFTQQDEELGEGCYRTMPKYYE